MPNKGTDAMTSTTRPEQAIPALDPGANEPFELGGIERDERRPPLPSPDALGHEGAGIVEQAGPGIERVGDRVNGAHLLRGSRPAALMADCSTLIGAGP
jgi:hypothetical protein